MPFKSQAQRRYLYATDPELAKKFEAETPKGAKLPERVKKKKKKRKKKIHEGFDFISKLDEALGVSLSPSLGATKGASKGSIIKDDSDESESSKKKKKEKN